MKYIIACGGPRSGKPLRKIYDESLVERTIRLLQANGVSDIAISSHDDRYEQFGVPVLKHDNPHTWDKFCWLKCFYPTSEPVCYLFGDVFYSPEAIRTIVQTEVDDIEFFASSPPFSYQYMKRWAEPFAFKVQNVEWFFKCVEQTIKHSKEFNRPPISWELWQVIKNTTFNRIDYTNYVAINDYTVDIDDDKQIAWLKDRGYGNG